MVETTARQVVLSFLIFSVVIAAGMSMLALSIDTSNTNYNQYNASINKLNTLNSQISPYKSTLEGGNPETDILNTLYRRTLGIFPLIWNSYETFIQIIEESSLGGLGLQLPGWIYLFISGVILVTLSFALMSAWYKWKI